MSQQYQVRIKPYNRKRGFKVRCLFHRGKRYLERAGWYSPIPKWLADELAQLTQTDDDEKAVFDVVTIEEAQRIEAAEMAEAKQGQAKHAVPFDAGSVRGAPEPEPEPEPEPAPEPESHAEYESDEEDRPKPAPKPAPKTTKKAPAKGRRGAKAK